MIKDRGMDEEKFTQLFAPFRAITPSQETLGRVLETVTISRVRRFSIWTFAGIMVPVAVFVLLVWQGNRPLNPTREILAMEEESSQIEQELILLDSNLDNI